MSDNNTIKVENFTLANGVEMPSIGFGCAFGNWSDPALPITFLPEQGWKAFSQALSVGYTHFDTALVYRTQRILGQQLGRDHFEQGGERKGVFVATKVGHPPTSLGLGRRGDFMDYSDAKFDDDEVTKETIWTAFEKCLEDLGVGYVDLLLVHWPGNIEEEVLEGEEKEKKKQRGAKLRKAVWKAMEEIYNSKQARAIGVSNFSQRHLSDVLESCSVKPMVNQIEVSPYIQPRELINFCKENGVLVEAWSPFGSGTSGVLQDELVKELAKKYGKNVGQVVIRFLIQDGMAVLPRSGSKERARGNLDVFDFRLTEEEMEKMRGLNRGKSCIPGIDLEKIY